MREETVRGSYNTVIKHITKDENGRRIIQINAIQRILLQSTNNSCRFLFEELPDWYSENNSIWFNKTQLSFINLSFLMESTP